MTKTTIINSIDELRKVQNPKIDYADLVCAEGFSRGHHYVWDDPLDYAIEDAINCMEKELEILENKELTFDELKNMIGEPVYILEFDRWGIIGEKECTSFGVNGREEFNRFVIGFSYGYEWLDDFTNKTFYKYKPVKE